MTTHLIRSSTITALLLITIGVPFATLGVAHAQTPPLPCGNIIAPPNVFFLNEPSVTTPITDCENPFNRTETIASPYTLKIDGTTIPNGGTATVPAEGTNGYGIEGEPIQFSYIALYYLHDGNDYRYVDTQLSEPEESDYRAFAAEFFEPGTDIEPYMEAIVNETLSLEDPDMQNLLYDFLDYVNANYVPVQPHLLPGTYTVVVHDYDLILGSRSLFERVRELIVPTAHAADDTNYRFTITFTLVEEQAPIGASSVLFLPGIQASNLYTSGIAGEDRLWPPSPNFGQDVSQLLMTAEGESVNNVYTRDVIDSVFQVGTVYGGLLDFLDELKTSPLPIKEYTAFAYDWRFSPLSIAQNGTYYEDGIRSLIDETERLAEQSHTQKVTIITHSNGGLVAKALVKKLEELGRDDIVDHIIFIGVPHLGTPKAIASVLHGYDQADQYEIAINQRGAREVIRNMPGAYGLLPSEAYFEGLDGNLISFDTSVSTQSYRNFYGSTINTFDAYSAFLVGVDGDGRSLSGPLSNPSRANQVILTEAFAEHMQLLDNWVAPEHIQVTEIVGVGFPTIKSLQYREVDELVCPLGSISFIFCSNEKILKPYAILTRHGDATVVRRSAGGYVGEKRNFYVDIETYNDTQTLKLRHFNLTEAPEIQTLLGNIINATTSDINFISDTFPEVVEEYTVEIIDSPVRIRATDSEGRVTGLTIENGTTTKREDIPGSSYFEFGETKYLIIPKGVQHTTELFGEAFGGYSLTIARLATDDTQHILHTLKNASTTSTMKSVYTVRSDGTFSTVVTDYDNDGVIDNETTIDGTPIVYTYTDLRNEVATINLRRGFMAPITQLINLAEQMSKQKVRKPALREVEKFTLRQLVTLLRVYKEKGVISAKDFKRVERIIVSIINNV